MLKEFINTLFDNSAARTGRMRTGERVKLGGPEHVKHYIDVDGAIVEHVAQPDYLDYRLSTIDAIVDYLAALAAAEKSEVVVNGRGFSIDAVDVIVSDNAVLAWLDRNANRDSLRVHLGTSAAANVIVQIGRPDDDENVAEGLRLRQAAVVRLFDLDLRGYVDAGVVKKFEKISWSGGDTQVSGVMRDKTSLGHEIEATALSVSTGADPSELPDYVDISFPWYDDPIFNIRERWSTVRMFVFPDLQARTIELVVRPDELTDAANSAVQHVVTFIRDNLKTKTGSELCRVVGG